MSRRRPCGLVWLPVLVGLLVPAAPFADHAVSAAPDPCPASFPVGDLSVGDPLSGLTVETGMTPDPFTGEVLGVLRDGIAPGIDLIIVDVDSDAIERAGGVWSGMSGSPVYAADGRLVGAVAYGLSYGGSSIAGVTPAEAMYDLLGSPPATPTSTEPIDVPADVADDIVDRGSASAAEVASGLVSLAIPLGVSGLAPRHHSDLIDRMGGRARLAPYATGSASGTASAAPLVAGGNVATSLTSGAVSIAAVGTVTAVCGNDVLMFGHPFRWTGGTTLGAHRAKAIVVQPAGVEAGFKVAQPLSRVGTVRQDRLAGLWATTGLLTDQSLLAGTLSGSRVIDNHATSRVVTPGFIANGTWAHLLSHLSVVADRFGGGSTTLDWTARGHREDGRPWRLSRGDVTVSNWDASAETAFTVAFMMRLLKHNRFEKITVDSLTYEGSISADKPIGRIVALKQRLPGGKWVKVAGEETMRIVAGRELTLRAVVIDKESRERQEIPVGVRVPHRAGEGGWLVVEGGEWSPQGASRGMRSFDDVLRVLRQAPSGDEVQLRLVVDPEGDPVERSDVVHTDLVTSGGIFIPVELVAKKK